MCRVSLIDPIAAGDAGKCRKRVGGLQRGCLSYLTYIWGQANTCKRGDEITNEDAANGSSCVLILRRHIAKLSLCVARCVR